MSSTRVLENSSVVPRPTRAGRRKPEQGIVGNEVPLTVENRTGAVVDRLADLILSGVIEAGSPLPSERDLAARLGVSRNVLREATKILQSRGLLTIKHGMRTMVNGVTSEPMQQAVSGALYGQDDALLQLTEARMVLEVGIAELAAERATERDIEVLQELVKQLDACTNEPKRYAEIDIAFHRALAEATHNNVFPLMLDSVSGLLHESLHVSLNYDPPGGSVSLHQHILQAIVQRAPAAAGEAMRTHIKTQKAQFEQVFQKTL
jgi:DNA-binding FadR family transcriptional regulator